MTAYFAVMKIFWKNSKELEYAQYIIINMKQKTPHTHTLVSKACKNICKSEKCRRKIENAARPMLYLGL